MTNFSVIIVLFFIITVIAVTIQNENDLIENLSKNNNNEINLTIENDITVTKNITLSTTVNKLSFIGTSLSTSKLIFNYPIYFDDNVEKIELKNIEINGTLLFHNNKHITLDNVILNGNIHTDMDDNANEYIKFNHLIYRPIKNTVHPHCINIKGNLEISDSELYGSSSCQQRLLNFDGLKNYQILIKNSYFSGENQCPCLSITQSKNANIIYSIFEKGFSNKEMDGGAAIRLTSTLYPVTVNYSTFDDFLSYNNGGAFYINEVIDFQGNSLTFNNVTSLELGSMAHIESNFLSSISLYNITQKNTGNRNGMKNGGLIMNIENEVSVNIDNYHAENLVNKYSSGSAFIVSKHVSINIRNLYINKLIGNGEYGLFYTCHDSKNIEFSASNVVLNDLYQLSNKENTIFYVEGTNKINLTDMKVLNCGGQHTSFYYQEENSVSKFKNLTIENFHSKTAKELINYQSSKTNENFSFNFDLDEFKLNNFTSQGPIFKLKLGFVNINNSEFKNIHLCNLYNNCENKVNDKELLKSEIVLSYIYNAVIINNSSFENIYGGKGTFSTSTAIFFGNSIVKNSYFRNGFIYLDETVGSSGNYYITNSRFENNTSENGSIIHIEYLDRKTGTFLSSDNSVFIGNKASNYGGVIYSMGPYDNLHIQINDCTFTDNHAKLGDIIYSLSRESTPYINNIKELEAIEGAVVTNPTKLILDEDSINKISIYSGDTIPNNITSKLFDDYGKQLFFQSDPYNMNFNEFVYTSVEINDTYNAEVIGSYQSFCWDDGCVFPQVKVFGNPGIYSLILKIQSFGPYSNFKNNSAEIEVEILECNKPKYINQYMGRSYYKTCYFPKCETSCNSGDCINNNVCDCSKTHFTGQYCNEYEKLNRMEKMDIFITMISVLMIIASVIIIYFLLHCKNYPNIKGGGLEFLIIIIIGSIVNSIYLLFLTVNKTTTKCYRIYLYKNTGFSLVFGSILVKTLRIFRIFHQNKNMNSELEKRYMYLIIFFITFFHWIIAIIWVTNNKTSIESQLTKDFKEYQRCNYPVSKNISTLFNFIVILSGFILSYLIRDVDDRFKENIGFSVYTFVICTILVEIINNQDEINIIIQDIIDAFGTIICTVVVLYYLYIKKFIDIFKGTIDKNQSNVMMFQSNKFSEDNMFNINHSKYIKKGHKSIFNGGIKIFFNNFKNNKSIDNFAQSSNKSLIESKYYSQDSNQSLVQSKYYSQESNQSLAHNKYYSQSSDKNLEQSNYYSQNSNRSLPHM